MLIYFSFVSSMGMYIIGGLLSLILFPIWFHINKIKWWHGLIVTTLQILFAFLFAMGFACLERQRLEYSGVSYYGCIFTLWIIPLIYGLITKLDYKKLIDIIAPLHLFMLFFMKIGCHIEGCCYGIKIDGKQVPIQMIESIVALVLCIALLVCSKFLKGITYPVLLVSYGTVRFIEEFFRFHKSLVGGVLSLGQIWSIVVFIIGITLLLLNYFISKKKKQNEICLKD